MESIVESIIDMWLSTKFSYHSGLHARRKIQVNITISESIVSIGWEHAFLRYPCSHFFRNYIVNSFCFDIAKASEMVDGLRIQQPNLRWKCDEHVTAIFQISGTAAKIFPQRYMFPNHSLFDSHSIRDIHTLNHFRGQCSLALEALLPHVRSGLLAPPAFFSTWHSCGISQLIQTTNNPLTQFDSPNIMKRPMALMSKSFLSCLLISGRISILALTMNWRRNCSLCYGNLMLQFDTHSLMGVEYFNKLVQTRML